MTREEALENAIHYKNIYPSICDDGEGFWNAVIEALKAEPCEDTISRQDVLEQTYNWSKDEFLRVTNPFDYLRKRINSLPSVTTHFTPKVLADTLMEERRGINDDTI